jgi:hypothetical protein
VPLIEPLIFNISLSGHAAYELKALRIVSIAIYLLWEACRASGRSLQSTGSMALIWDLF